VATRIDYVDDPSAPAPNSLVPSVNCVVDNNAGEILLIERTDNGNWSLPGGAMELGESVAEAAVRETLEETGVLVEVTGIVGIYTDPRHVVHYTSNDEVRQEFSIVFSGRPLSGVPTPSDESSQVRWVAPSDVGLHRMHGSMRKRLTHYLERRSIPHIG
jgi:8-oxo-dGTP pyrophosphatase MutT (NUDIX family)